MPDLNAVLDQGHVRAIELVDLIQHVDLADTPDEHPASQAFARECTTYIRQAGARLRMKRIIDRLVPQVRASRWEMRMLDTDPTNVAAKLATTAIKALVAGASPNNRWVLDHRLAVKFENCADLWIEDEQLRPEDLVIPAAAAAAKN